MNQQTIAQLFEPHFLVLAAALLAGWTVLEVARRLRWHLPRRDAGSVVLQYVEHVEPGAGPAGDIQLNRQAVILASLGLPWRPHLLTTLRLAATLLPPALLLLLRYPPVLALGAAILAAILSHTWLQGRWRRFCYQLEAELPTFTSRLAGTLLVTASPLAALDEVVQSLPPDSPLRLWLQAFLQGLQRPGRAPFLQRAQQEAETLSVSLALVVFEIGRLLETGGGGFTQAFRSASEHLGSILRTRAVARAKAEAARNAVLTMLAIMTAVVFLMLSAPQNRTAYQDPLVQLVALACLAAMALGYLLLNHMIDQALEA